MARITNEVLAEKIDSLHASLEELKPIVRANTEFRMKSKGIIGAATVVAGFLGAGIMAALSFLKEVLK